LNVNDQTTGTNLSRTLNKERMIMELLNVQIKETSFYKTFYGQYRLARIVVCQL